MAKRKSKKITTKAVQAFEDTPAPIPQVDVKPEVDADEWGRDGLTLKQRRFCEAYVGIAAGNATRAAQLAGYRDDNMLALGATASENLKKPQIRGYISRLLARQGLSTKFLKSRLAQLAQSSMDNVVTVDANGQPHVDLKQAMEIGALCQIREIKDDGLQEKGGGAFIPIRRTVKLHDPTKAIELLLRMNGAIIDRHEHRHSGKVKHDHAVQSVMRDVMADADTLNAARTIVAKRNKALAGTNGNGNGHAGHN